MQDVRLVLRGMWFRRGVSLAVLVIASLVVGAAVTGPLFLRSAGESVLRDTLSQALPIGRIVTDHIDGTVRTRPLPEVVRRSTEHLRTVPTLNRLLVSPVASLQVQAIAGTPGKTGNPAPLVYRAGVCSHVTIRKGRCATRTGSVIVSASAAASQHWRVGEVLEVNGRRVTVAGVYAPLEPTGDYWAGRPYFAAYSGSGVAGDQGSTLDAIFAPRATVEAQPADTVSVAAVDRYLDLDRIRLSDLPALRRDLGEYNGDPVEFAPDGTASDTSAMVAVLIEAGEIKDKLTLPVWVVEIQLLVLCWLILFLVVANASEARGPEVALAKLRGVPSGRTVAFGLLDTLVLVVLAVPIGFAFAVGWVAGIAALSLAPSTPVVITGAAGLAALGAGLGAAVAAVLAGSRTLRRPVVEQWRRASRRAKARPWAVDVVAGLASVAGLVVLARRGAVGTEPGSPSVLALVAPGLIVLAAALIGSRVLPILCRAAYARTRRRRAGLGGFLAVRQLGRRPSTLRLALVLSVAFGLVAFAIDAWAVTRTNAHDRAWTEVGAAEVLTVSPPPGKDLAAIVNRLDPSGRQATAVSTATQFLGSDQVQLLAVQPDRFARIAFWRGDFGPASLPRLTDRLTTTVAPPVMLSGDELRVTVRAGQLSGGRQPLLVAEVAQREGGLTPIDLGPLHQGANTLTVDLPCLTGGCRLAGVHLDRPAGAFYPIDGTLTLTGVSTRTGSTWRSVDAHLSKAHAWRPGGQGATAATPTGSGLTLTTHAADADTPTWQVADTPAALPALATGPPTDAVRITGLTGQALAVHPLSTGPALPGAGTHGVVVDRAYAQRALHGFNTVTSETVWLAPSALDTFPHRLEQAGVAILDTSSAAHQTAIYERQGPALAILLFLAGAMLGALLAAGGAVLHLHLTGRRRTYELAAMSALGVRRGTLLRSLYAEQSLLILFGIAVGVASGVVGAVLTVPVVPEFADSPTTPPMLYGLHSGPVLAMVGVVIVLLAVVVAASSANLLRTSRFDQLREAPA